MTLNLQLVSELGAVCGRLFPYRIWHLLQEEDATQLLSEARDTVLQKTPNIWYQDWKKPNSCQHDVPDLVSCHLPLSLLTPVNFFPILLWFLLNLYFSHRHFSLGSSPPIYLLTESFYLDGPLLPQIHFVRKPKSFKSMCSFSLLTSLWYLVTRIPNFRIMANSFQLILNLFWFILHDNSCIRVPF